MNATTLRGVFPEPKPPYKRNFIKENVRHIKQMQGLLQNSGLFEPKSTRSKSVKPSSNCKSSHNLSNRPLSQSRSQSIPKVHKTQRKKHTKDDNNLQKPPILTNEEPVEKHTSRGIQTEKPENISKLYENGVIKYPSAAVLRLLTSKQSPEKRKERYLSNRDHGDTEDTTIISPHNDITGGMQALGITEKHDFIKQNIMALKQKPLKADTIPDPLQNYQKGVLPKYLRDRKELKKEEIEIECPAGHVLLPEEERKETLRVLRQISGHSQSIRIVLKKAEVKCLMSVTINDVQAQDFPQTNNSITIGRCPTTQFDKPASCSKVGLFVFDLSVHYKY